MSPVSNSVKSNIKLDLNILEQTMNAYLRETLGVNELYLPADITTALVHSDSELLVARDSEVAKSTYAFELFIDQNDLFSIDLLNNKNNKVKYLVIHLRQTRSVFGNETRDIFAKMVQALKLSPQHLLVLEAQATSSGIKALSKHLQDWLVAELKSPMKILILSEKETQAGGLIKGRHQFFVTHSPYDFISQSADLKKVAWAVMQSFVSE